MIPTSPGRVPGLALLAAAALAGCKHTVEVEPIRVEPIDITLHIYLEADQKLDAFFSDVEGSAGTEAGARTAARPLQSDSAISHSASSRPSGSPATRHRSRTACRGGMALPLR